MAGENAQTSDIGSVIAQALASYNTGAAGGVGQDLVYVGPTGGEKKTITLKRSGKTITTTQPNVKTTQELVSMYLNDPKMQANWRQTMQKYGLETGNKIAERKAFEAAVVGASDWYTTSNGKQKVTPEQYLGWYAGGQKKEENLPTRQIYAVTPAQIDADVNDIALKRLGRAITDADKQAGWYKDLVAGINKLYQTGIVTETKKVKNPVTGKMENVVTQTPGFSTEQVTEKIASTLEGADPVSVERKKNLEFANWAFQKMGGRG